MNKTNTILLVFTVIAFYSSAQCQESAHIAKICEATEGIFIDEASNTICFNGLIDHSTPLLVKALPIDRNRSLRLVANSDGGIVNPSIDIAEYLDSYDIYVTQHCLSACSQFLFMQAKNKYVIHQGIVAIHGGPVPKEDIMALDFPDKDKNLLILEGVRFEKFYHDRGINIDILTTPPVHLHDRLRAGEIIFWMPKKAEFEHYGVHNIHYCDSEFGK